MVELMQVGDKRAIIAVSVKNNSTTVTIPRGAPVFYQFNGTDDGLAVVNAATASTGGQNGFAGILTADLPPGAKGKAIAYGIATARVLTTGTAIAVNDVFTVVTTASADQITRSGAGAAISGAIPPFSATKADATATGASIYVPVFVRAL